MNAFDYIIVGAGSAGCVIAARLSEDPTQQVLLLEAGPPADNFWINTPGGVAKLFEDKRFNWGFKTESVESLGGRTVNWPRGKALGGSSAINGMVYMRGHPADFDHWTNLGNEGWGWSDVLPYFKKSERNVRGGDDYFGGDGELSVTDPVQRHPTTDDFLQSVKAVGIPEIRSLNAPPFEGVSYQQFTIRGGRRETSYTAFIKPILGRKNLTVRTGVHVLRVIVEGGEATGVEILDRGETQIVKAAREVVVSAGALSSPQILMLSGIGARDHLQGFDIPVIVDLPGVGENLQDHWAAPFVARVGARDSYNSNLQGLRKYVEGARYLFNRRGFLALGSSAVSAYVKTSPDQLQPDLQLAIRPVSAVFRPDGSVVIDPKPGIGGAVVLVGPKSTGRMELKSPDPLKAPAFHPNYLSDPSDMARTLYGMRLLRRVLAAEPLARRIAAEVAPGPAVESDQDLSNFIRQSGNTAWHQTGTCKMGCDEMAVVDARLRVHQIKRLRVADASIMPRITSGNTNAPSIMIGEKAADMIIADRSPPRVVTT
ncbi:choline dehydrogenase [Rhizobium leguminosarum]|uniref:GMC family oxidoreductase n=1 Tax=Rhizobium leguminosarum TaxID=384 RepID=UPI0024B38ADB|nr:GMC family oxidoreductase N-terminal domain-containing protein [Rhizobium leguminosarum]WHO82640.1 GMC family oxidoreductase N-terminal domain-containing protein [Rhizobium leguminosarum]